MHIVPLGHKNAVPAERLLMILQTTSSSVKSMISRAGASSRLIDAADGKRRRCAVLTSDGFVVLSSLTTNTIKNRFQEGGGGVARIVPVGHFNFVPTDKIQMILQIKSSKVKKLIQAARDENRVIDATNGDRTDAAIFTTEGYFVLSCFSTRTLAKRFRDAEGGDPNSLTLLGHGNFMPSAKIHMILSIGNSRPIKDFVDKAKAGGSYLNVGHGRASKSLILTTDGFAISSSIMPEALAGRYAGSESDEKDSEQGSDEK